MELCRLGQLESTRTLYNRNEDEQAKCEPLSFFKARNKMFPAEYKDPLEILF